jgi:hypothetical protein
VAFLWLIAQYRPEALSEPVEIDPLNDEFIYRSPPVAAAAIKTIYGGAAADVIDRQIRNADDFHAAKWQQVRNEISRMP